MYIHTEFLSLFRHGSGGANFRLVRFTLSATLVTGRVREYVMPNEEWRW